MKNLQFNLIKYLCDFIFKNSKTQTSKKPDKIIYKFNPHQIYINGNNEEGSYLLLIACINKNIDMIKLFIDYANKNNIILNINEKK